MTWIVRELACDEKIQTYSLVERCFDAYVRCDLTEEGVEEFFRAAKEMIYRQPSNHFLLVAWSDDTVLGMCDVRDFHHISLFFVDPAFQQRGIGRALMTEAQRRCLAHHGAPMTMTVNSSVFAEPVYARLGFESADGVQKVNGIRFVPMKMELVQ